MNFSRIKISCKNSYRNLIDFYEQNSGRINQKDYKNALVRYRGFECYDFIPKDNFEFGVNFCPVDCYQYSSEEKRAQAKINVVVDKCKIVPYNITIDECCMFANRKEMMMVFILTYSFNLLLQLNQDVDLHLSSHSTSYLLSKMNSLFKEKLGVKFSREDLCNFIYEQFSDLRLKFKTEDCSNKISNVSECYTESGVLYLIFEMPRRL